MLNLPLFGYHTYELISAHAYIISKTLDAFAIQRILMATPTIYKKIYYSYGVYSKKSYIL